MAEGGGAVDVIVSAELQDRLDQVERQLQGMQGELLQTTKEYMAVQAKIEFLEKTGERHTEELRELKEMAKGLQKQYDRLGEKIDQLESKLFAWMQQLQKDNAEMIKAAQVAGAAERQSTQKSWMTFLQYVLGGTIFIIVAYVFGINFIK